MTDLRATLDASLRTTYRIERELGGGGMARVFLAEELGLGRRVVIKVLNPALAATVSADRFRREITLAAALQHPHIVPLLTAGQVGELLYYTMPYVEGETLRDRLGREGELPVAEAVRILKELAAALAYAHRHRIVHRDIKPENVLLSDGSVVVADFGIAKAVSEARTSDGETLTATGVSVGTPAYMAPEQAAADPATDHRADLYAFGVVGYELLTGHRPFEGRNAQALFAAHAAEVPEAVTTRRAAVPAALGELIMRCLAKRPADRPQTAAELVAGLERMTTPVLAVAGRPMRSPRRWIGLAVAGVIVAAAGWLVARRGPMASPPEVPGAERPKSVAVLPLVNVGADTTREYFADGMTEELIGALSHVPGLRVTPRTSAFAFKGKTEGNIQDIARQLGVGTLLVGSIQRVGERVRVRVQLTSAADGLTLWGDSFDRQVTDVLDVQREIATAVAGALRIQLAPGGSAMANRSRNPEAYDHYLRGRYHFAQGTKESLERALDQFQRAAAADSAFAAAYLGTAWTYIWLADGYLDNDIALPKALGALERAYQLDPESGEILCIRAHTTLMYAHEEVLTDLERAAAKVPNDAWCQLLLGWDRSWFADSAGGLGPTRAGIGLDPLSPMVQHIGAFVLMLLGRLDDAAVQARKAEQLAPVWVYHEELSAVALLEAGITDTAMRLFRAAERNQGFPTVGLAVGLLRSGQAAEGRRVLVGIEERWRRQYLPPELLAYGWAQFGERERALRWLEEGIRRRSGFAVFSLVHPWLAPLRGDPRFEQILRTVGLRGRPR